MKIPSILLQFALVVALGTSSFAALEVDSQHTGSSVSGTARSGEPDVEPPLLSGFLDASRRGHFGGSHDGAPFHHGDDRFRDGSGSGFSDIGSHDGSHFHDYDHDGSHGSGYPCERYFDSSSGSHGGSGSGSSSRHHHKRYFRGDVGDDYDFGSRGEDSDDSFDGSGSSSSGYIRCRHHHSRHGSDSGSGSEGSHAFYDDVGEDDDEESSGSLDSPRSRHHQHHAQGSSLGSDSGDSPRFRGSHPGHTN